jgi:hypothetical protein
VVKDHRERVPGLLDRLAGVTLGGERDDNSDHIVWRDLVDVRIAEDSLRAVEIDSVLARGRLGYVDAGRLPALLCSA